MRRFTLPAAATDSTSANVRACMKTPGKIADPVGVFWFDHQVRLTAFS